MNNKYSILCIAATVLLAVGCAMPLKMETPPEVDLSHLKALPYTAGLYFSPELKAYQYELVTSPFDSVVYPLGAQTVEIFKQSAAKVFSKVITIDSPTAAEGIDFIVKPTIVKFEAVIPNPAYNPYTATMVYQTEIVGVDGKTVLNQKGTGDAQTSKGLLSGFSARSISADVAQQAMVAAAKQVMEGIVDSEEISELQQ